MPAENQSPGWNFCSRNTGCPSRTEASRNLGTPIPAVPIVYPEQRRTLKPEFSVDMAGQREALHPIVLQVCEISRDIRLGNRRIGGRRIDDRDFGLQSQPQHDVGGFGIE